MPAPTYDYRVDWSGNGSFGDTGENVTSRVLADSISMSYGRDQARALSPLAPGEARFDLDNTTRDYSPENGSSPLTGLLGPGRPVRIQATHLTVTYGLFRGFLDGFNLVPEDAHAKFTCTDELDKIRDTDISTDLYRGIRTGTAVGLVLDAVGWPTADRDIDPGATTIRYWWAEGDAGAEIEKLVHSEGPPALVTVDPDGRFVFRDRHHRLTRTPSTASQATFRAGANADPRFSPPLGYDHGWRDIVNAARFVVDVRESDGELTDVWRSSDTISVADGETVQIKVQASDPFLGAVTPELGTDYGTVFGAVQVALSRTSGRTALLSVKGVGGPAVITDVRIRGYAIPVTHRVHVGVEDPTSIAKHGQRSWPSAAPWAGAHDALGIATTIVGQRAERLPIITLRVAGYSDTNLTQMLSRDLSDRVTVIDSLVGLNDDVYIERIGHTIRGAGSQLHETEFGCEKAPTPPAGFILGTSVLNTGVLGAAGYDNPATIFKVDTSLLGTGMLAH